MKKNIQLSIYPLTIILSYLIFIIILDITSKIESATFWAMAFGAFTIFLGEKYMPFKKEWQGFDTRAGTDGLYLLLVHGLLGKLIQAGALSAIVLFSSYTSFKINFWPNHFPMALQIILLISLSEFVRYWIHYYCHHSPLLWRFHAVHHSTEKLYWWNVGRFHPIEKVFQLCGESILFIFMGVNPLALGLYFVFYAVNGFFQHCNIDMRLGLLNRIISGPEQHRYHHSYQALEANNNFGNKLSLYDQIFGTYFLPDSLGPTHYGLKNKNYPQNFIDQLLAPFIHDLDQTGTFSLKSKLMNLSIRIKGGKIYKKHLESNRSLVEIQTEILLKILKKNKQTSLGLKYHFADIDSISKYQENIPIHEYEDLRAYYEDQESKNTYGLITNKPVFYTQTSGSTSKAKLIPILEETIRANKDSQNFSLFEALKKSDNYTVGNFLVFTGQKIEGHTVNGLEIGSASAHFIASFPKIISSLYVVPSAVFEIADVDLRYNLVLRIILNENNITFIGCANPSTLLKLEVMINEKFDLFITDLSNGSFFDSHKLDQNIVKVIKKKLTPRPEKAQRLKELYKSKGKISLHDLLPKTVVVATWQGGSCKLAFEKIKKSFSEELNAPLFHEIGYLASEARISVPLTNSNGEMLTIYDHFFEFKPVDEINNNQYLLLHQLKFGIEYMIYLTTYNGLYRYNINDVIRVDDFRNGIPLIRFIRKGTGVTSITGEKLYENQFLEAVSFLNENHQLKLNMIALADEENAYYIALIEGELMGHDLFQLELELDNLLRKINIEYDSKRCSDRLHALKLIQVNDGFIEEFAKQEILIKKVREAQWKLKALLTLKVFEKIFSEWKVWQRK
ncbi:MAG: GH3 auxin-responsive promoter family protein [Bacteriovorax sp.]|nr:GH3 auxin-responsive promoter family protein [Bacteriovorax sp.]